ncbi:hypothetical protein Pyn_00502 [Prunus yedoensis var. nudiflora]|uniref:Uncharacterized protein n=1 Tax=Prunus yedoensis var. nudiflora TaxID=2094558 RepID=A0A314UJ29_PRUYE|nr:hypothetical protein Pyn_00502 [Prunus yedoensis var. nudiflora]
MLKMTVSSRLGYYIDNGCYTVGLEDVWLAAGMADKILVNRKFTASMFAKTFKNLTHKEFSQLFFTELLM